MSKVFPGGERSDRPVNCVGQVRLGMTVGFNSMEGTGNLPTSERKNFSHETDL